MGNSHSSSRQILKSTAVIGGSNLLVAATQLVRMKVFALFLGPTGLGLVGIFHSIMATAAMMGGLGLTNSGVREVSKSDAAGDERELATVVRFLPRLAILLGLVSAIILFFLRQSVSNWIFDAEKEGRAVGLLSLGVFFTIVSGSQVALLNGLRRLQDLARVNVFSAIIGTGVAVTLVWIWGTAAIPAVIVSTAFVTLIFSWWYARRVRRSPVSIGYAEARAKSFALLRLGSAFMSGELVMVGALFLTRVILLNQLGLASAGYFQAAWAVVVVSIDFILNAMGLDFFPSLTSRVRDRDGANQLVNEQTEVALLLGGPLILGMILFAPVLMALLFTSAFGAATDLLCWLLLGNIIKIVSWPMGFLIMAHARAKMFLALELIWGTAYLGGVLLGPKWLGLNAVGYAFLFSYLIYGAALYVVVRRLFKFAWTTPNLRLALTLFGAGVLVLTLTKHAGLVGYLISAPIFLLLSVYCVRRLSRLAETGSAVRIVQAVRRRVVAMFP